MKKIFLIGYYGYDNLGDDLLLYEIVEKLKLSGRFEISALSFDAKKISALYGIKGVSRLKSFSIVNHIRSVDVVVCGGGSILQDKTSSKSLYYYMGILFLAKLFGKKIYLLGNGYGPIDKAHNKMMVSMLLKFANGVIARDEESFAKYGEHRVKHLYNGVDCAFLGELGRRHLNEDVEFTEYRKRHRIEKPYVIFTLRNWSGFEMAVEELKKSVDLLRQKGYEVCFLSMKMPEDETIVKKHLGDGVIFLERQMKILPLLFKSAEFTVGMRLHGIILSAIFQTPFIAIPYDPKVESFVKHCEQLSTKRVEKMSGGELQEMIEIMLQKRDEYKALLESKIPQMQEIAAREFDLFLEWIS